MQSLTQVPNSPFQTLWQRSVPSIAWGTLLLGLGIILAYTLTLGLALSGALPYAAATLILSYLTYASFTVMHDAGHGSIFNTGSKIKGLESILGWIFSVPLLIAPFRIFQKIHDRHHAFTNDPERDPDHYTLTKSWLGVAANSLYIPIQYHILAFTKLRKIKVIRDTYWSTFLYLVFTFGSIAALIANGYGKEVMYFAIMPSVIAVFVLAMLFDYLPHHPHKSRDRYHDTRIYPGNLMNMLLLGQNYHLIHHMYPRLPWYKYKQVYQRILPDLEARNAPIEDVAGGVRPGFLQSPNVRSLLDGGQAINMVLKVSSIRHLTPDAVEIDFALPEGEILNYQAGQYILVSKWLNHAYHTRCYSLCAKPGAETLKIAVRKTENGLVSQYLNNSLNVGDELVVQGPFGDFTYPSEQIPNHANLVLIAGGSGITPLLAIIETALATNKCPKIDLIYANKDRQSTMFSERLEQLQTQFSRTLNIHYVYSVRRSSYPLIDKDLITKDTQGFYICGPEGLRNKVVKELQSHGVHNHQIQVEEFKTSIEAPVGKQHKVDIDLADGTQQSIAVASNQTVLDVAISKNISLSHACKSGTCGSCKLQVVKGNSKAIPDSIPGITQDEKDEGIILACQCKPAGAMSLRQL